MKWELLIANENYNIHSQLIIAFCTGLVFSPWSYGWIFFVIFLIVWEVMYGFATKFKHPRWNLAERILIIVISLLGWTVGRLLVGQQPFDNNRKKLKWNKLFEQY